MHATANVKGKVIPFRLSAALAKGQKGNERIDLSDQTAVD
jgi:hypothetical protein